MYDVNEIIQMAWCDKTSFEDIFKISGLDEKSVIKLMRTLLKKRSYRLWRKRVYARLKKHRKMLKVKSINII